MEESKRAHINKVIKAMETIKIDHIHDVAGIKKTKGKVVIIGTSPEFLIQSILNKELSKKKIKMIEAVKGTKDKILFEAASFSELKRHLNRTTTNPYYQVYTIIKPENIKKLYHQNEGETVIELNDFSAYEEAIIESKARKEFDWARDFKNYSEARELFKESVSNGCLVQEDEGVEGRLLLIKKENKIIKSLYFKDEEIKIMDSPESVYIKHHTEEIKDHLEELNKNLQLKGEKPIQLELEK